jgi:hypothetical protein
MVWNSDSRSRRCRVNPEARFAEDENPGTGQRNRAAGQLQEILDARLELSLPKRSMWVNLALRRFVLHLSKVRG